MLELVDVGPRSLSAYRGVAPDAVLDLRGARVFHVNATPYGGGVSELLRSGVPILNDLGLIARWKIIRGDDRFFQVTKKVHNGLQGAADGLTETEREAYLGTSRRNAELLEERIRLCLPSRSAAGGHSVTPRKRQRPVDPLSPENRFTWISWSSFLLGFVESYGYGWYVTLIWVPLYNVFAARAARSHDDGRSVWREITGDAR